MPPSLRGRKASKKSVVKSTATSTATKKLSSIKAFASVTKSSSSLSGGITKKKIITSSKVEITKVEPLLEEIEAEEKSSKETTTEEVEVLVEEKKIEEALATPSSPLPTQRPKRKAESFLFTPPATPQKKTKVAVAAASAATPSKSTPRKGLVTPPSSSPSQQLPRPESTLPIVLANYITIHSNLLTYLLLNYSQKSLSVPEPIKTLIPHVSRSARRDIELDDVRRILWFCQDSLNVVDTRNSGLAIVFVGDNVIGRIDALREKFGRDIAQWWDDNKDVIDSEERERIQDVLKFAPTVPSKTTNQKSKTSAKNSGSILAKGQQRLSELKKFSLTKKTEFSDNSALFNKKENEKPASATASSRGNSLLERIRAKQAKSASAPAPPSKELLQRESALQSLVHIIPVLLQLSSKPSTYSTSTSNKLGESPGASTTSFPLTSVIAHIKQSVKTPISAEDAERAIRLLASDVATDWCRIVEWKKEGVREGRPLVGVVFERKGRSAVEGWKYSKNS